jgi:hypothetical protein
VLRRYGRNFSVWNPTNSLYKVQSKKIHIQLVPRSREYGSMHPLPIRLHDWVLNYLSKGKTLLSFNSQRRSMLGIPCSQREDGVTVVHSQTKTKPKKISVSSTEETSQVIIELHPRSQRRRRRRIWANINICCSTDASQNSEESFGKDRTFEVPPPPPFDRSRSACAP